MSLFVLGRSKYYRRYEPIWYGWHEKGIARQDRSGRRKRQLEQSMLLDLAETLLAVERRSCFAVDIGAHTHPLLTLGSCPIARPPDQVRPDASSAGKLVDHQADNLGEPAIGHDLREPDIDPSSRSTLHASDGDRMVGLGLDCRQPLLGVLCGAWIAELSKQARQVRGILGDRLADSHIAGVTGRQRLNRWLWGKLFHRGHGTRTEASKTDH